MANVTYLHTDELEQEYLAQLSDVTANWTPAAPFHSIILITATLPGTTTSTATDWIVLPALPNRVSILGMYVATTSQSSSTHLYANLVLGGGVLSGAWTTSGDATAQQGMNATATDVIGGTVQTTGPLVRAMTTVIPGFVIPDNVDPRIPSKKTCTVQLADDNTHHYTAGQITVTVIGALRS